MATSHCSSAVASAYGWSFDLGHGFHESRQARRFTISPQARAKVLDLLLALNHERSAAEQRVSAQHRRQFRSRYSNLYDAGDPH